MKIGNAAVEMNYRRCTKWTDLDIWKMKIGNAATANEIQYKNGNAVHQLISKWINSGWQRCNGNEFRIESIQAGNAAC